MRRTYDWTASYRRWEGSDVFEEEEKPLSPSSETSSEPAAFFQHLAHHHDHAVEREFFDRPESAKTAECERHRRRGNFLFHEGNLDRACEQYKIALSFYEYCFPELKEEEQRIDRLRRACLCNLSLCYLRQRRFREAVDAATQVIDEDSENHKAYFRRAQGYRGLDEYT